MTIIIIIKRNTDPFAAARWYITETKQTMLAP